MDKFWMVWVQEEGAPVRTHDTLELAMAEAAGLAAKEQHPVFVLEAIKCCELSKVKWTDLS